MLYDHNTTGNKEGQVIYTLQRPDDCSCRLKKQNYKILVFLGLDPFDYYMCLHGLPSHIQQILLVRQNHRPRMLPSRMGVVACVILIFPNDAKSSEMLAAQMEGTYKEQAKNRLYLYTIQNILPPPCRRQRNSMYNNKRATARHI